jgi:hypothetical protein
MDKQTIRQKLDVKRIWDDAYYGGRRIISDATYDALKDEIRLALEADPALNAEFSAEFTATSLPRGSNACLGNGWEFTTQNSRMPSVWRYGTMC